RAQRRIGAHVRLADDYTALCVEQCDAQIYTGQIRLGKGAGRQRVVGLRSAHRAYQLEPRTRIATQEVPVAVLLICSAQCRQKAFRTVDTLLVEITEEAAREADVRGYAHRQRD